MGKNIVFLSTYPPRQCGIATFTEDLVKNLRINYPSNSYSIIAIDDKSYNYGHDVLCSIDQFKKNNYKKISENINNSDVDLVVIEHEYGIYGGNTGDYVLDFIENLNVPFIVTLHTTLSKPNQKQKSIICKLGEKGSKVIIMAKNSAKILEDVYSIPEQKIEVIHHGVPDIAIPDIDCLKKTLGYQNRSIISTFGLLSPGKGIEYAIDAIGKVSAEHPEVLYLILGKTHPCIKKDFGESYRENLKNMVRKLGIENNIKFVDKYLTKKEIVQYLSISDIYMTPYLGEEQSVSGTLAYAAGYGKAIVSTPYRYAREMLKNKNGILAKFRDADSLYSAVEFLLDNPARRSIIEKNMLKIGKTMRWPNIAAKYNNLFSNIIKNNQYAKQVV
ncbi:MAG: glycosyltransferase family 4 protein [Clostridium sp.]|jgi:glycosyltransferase involved in cell wall biosynthesis|uniref:glycosyltransferase family 4 protein n=1 Tax=Clostridium sp. TaxID=1506 RepID=UPI0025BE26C9|nr:glycosyltransferase family 4 protein [Clostridium sp.]MCH3963179.1 glycosyltransferase family 4 protein [Clostridium sp.]MCI1716358.1 glycosyltransferase family 4 protein [Clostridium sp.]MCI1800698.1 glycosyltransferase family 4 protein [Clostridium sp.]MCI1814647.1 glycosyltransferase family 4 protein [Clostridium sp.]MCI1871557.1 glycosyltransferase family 4 protein [Clostridium sp.]